jgi:hypothetical protein
MAVGKDTSDYRGKITEVKRISDQSVSGHSWLADRFRRISLLVDTIVLASSLWLIAMVFVEPIIGENLTPPYFEKTIWLGLLALISFFLSLLQMLTGWKRKAEKHEQSAKVLASIKRDCSQLLSQEGPVPYLKAKIVFDKYDLVCSVIVAIPEKYFNIVKKKHLQKVEISKYLDQNSGVSIALFKIKVWFRDNVSLLRK